MIDNDNRDDLAWLCKQLDEDGSHPGHRWGVHTTAQGEDPTAASGEISMTVDATGMQQVWAGRSPT